MEDDYDLGLDTEDSQEPAPAQVSGTQIDWEKEARKARDEAHKLRAKLRRTEITAKYGEDIAELVPDAIPMKDWDSYAEKLQAKFASVRATDQTVEAQEESPPVETNPDAERLATVVQGSGPVPGAVAREPLSPKEILELGRQDPNEAFKRIKEQYGDS